jgi:hypothetical protein
MRYAPGMISALIQRAVHFGTEAALILLATDLMFVNHFSYAFDLGGIIAALAANFFSSGATPFVSRRARGAYRIVNSLLTTAVIFGGFGYLVTQGRDGGGEMVFLVGMLIVSGVSLAVMGRAVFRRVFNAHFNKATGSEGKYDWVPTLQLHFIPTAAVITGALFTNLTAIEVAITVAICTVGFGGVFLAATVKKKPVTAEDIENMIALRNSMRKPQKPV